MNFTLTKLGSALSRAVSRERVCESCGNGFSCGASLRGCWCSEIDLSDSAREELKALYQDCLCRKCLEKVSAKDQQPTT